MIHLDVAGVYFFPEIFVPVGGWRQYPFKITATMPSNMRIFDFSHMTPEEAIWTIEKAVGKDSFTSSDREKILNGGRNWRRTFWRVFQSKFSFSRGEWNAFFRKTLGYDAIFDDTDSIFTDEVQLVVLNPTLPKIVSIEDVSSSGYDAIKLTMQRVDKVLSQFGPVTATPPKKKSAGGSSKQVAGDLNVDLGDGHYTTWQVSARAPRIGRRIPSSIDVLLKYSNPATSSSWGGEHSFPTSRANEWDRIERDITRGVEDVISRIKPIGSDL
jgi:hypothetical protein